MTWTDWLLHAATDSIGGVAAALVVVSLVAYLARRVWTRWRGAQPSAVFVDPVRFRYPRGDRAHSNNE